MISFGILIKGEDVIIVVYGADGKEVTQLGIQGAELLKMSLEDIISKAKAVSP
jgi:hypothetical protein